MKKNSQQIIDFAQNILSIEAEEINNAKSTIDEKFVELAKLILSCRGRIVLSGMGKSGHIARKIASTFSSTGTAAFFMHPGEASHGDLGMIQREDIVIFFSNSGKSDELTAIIPNIKRIGAKIISITNNNASFLTSQSDIHINLNVKKEACPLGLAPTASSTVALAFGDALALSVLDLKEFTAEDFIRSHPGGNLGKNILLKVSDIMRKGKEIPIISTSQSIGDAIKEISNKLLGFTAVVNKNGQPIGIFTDGDLRRALLKNYSLTDSIEDVMTKKPITLIDNQLAIDAINKMEDSKINSFLVLNIKGDLVGVINLQDLLKSKVI
jgi:arabinose-5-phosphate isomerase